MLPCEDGAYIEVRGVGTSADWGVAGFGWLLSWSYIDSGKRALGHYAVLYDRRNHCIMAAICCATGRVICLEIEIEALSDLRSDA